MLHFVIPRFKAVCAAFRFHADLVVENLAIRVGGLHHRYEWRPAA